MRLATGIWTRRGAKRLSGSWRKKGWRFGSAFSLKLEVPIKRFAKKKMRSHRLRRLLTRITPAARRNRKREITGVTRREAPKRS